LEREADLALAIVLDVLELEVDELLDKGDLGKDFDERSPF